MSGDQQVVLLKVSPYDERSHVFDDIDKDTARAACRHSVPTRQLTEPTEDNALCLVCMVTKGHALAEQMGRADERGAVWVPFAG